MPIEHICPAAEPEIFVQEEVLKKLWCIFGILVVMGCKTGQKTGENDYKTPEQINEEITRLNTVNHMDYSFQEPLFFGIDSRNDLRMVIIQECRNRCNEKLYFLIYDGVSEEECKTLRGSALYRISTGIYLGCEPPFYVSDDSVE